MEILVGLIRLNTSCDGELENPVLPAPWFNRPALGLQTNTAVRIGVVATPENSHAPPDIIVTPLRTDRLHSTASIVIDLNERKGAVYTVLEQIGTEFNIALAETLTVDGRTRHRMTLVLEPVGEPDRPRQDVEALLADLKKRIGELDGHGHTAISSVMRESQTFARQETSRVHRGTVPFADTWAWYRKRYVDRFSKQYDFTKVVVSSSADGRFIRYVFPKRGAFQATISHLDAPSALAQIGRVLENLDYNILLSRLSRSTGREGTSIYVAVCEPNGVPVVTKAYGAEEAEKIIAGLEKHGAPQYQLTLRDGRVSLGTRVSRNAFPYRHLLQPEVRTVLAPPELHGFIQRYSHGGVHDLTGKRAIFLSYRTHFMDSPTGILLRDRVAGVVRRAGMLPFDGFEMPDRLYDNSPADIRARIWMCSGAIFFGGVKPGNESLSENQFVEWGINYGEGKRWVVIANAAATNQIPRFMMPERSYVVYDDLGTAALQKVEREVGELLDNWSDVWRLDD